MFTPLSICQESCRHASVLPANETFDIDPHVETGIIICYNNTAIQSNVITVVRMTEVMQYYTVLIIHCHIKMKNQRLL